MKLLMVGTKGLAKDLIDAFRYENYVREITLFDNQSSDLPDKLYGEYKILKTEAEVIKYLKEVSPFFLVALGSPKKRKEVAEQLKSLGGYNFSYISSQSLISKYANIDEEGVIVQLHCELSSDVVLKKGVFINVKVLIGHDVLIDEYTTISPSVNIMGNAKIGKNCVIATGVTIMPNVKIGDNVKIGMNMLVKDNVADNSIII